MDVKEIMRDNIMTVVTDWTEDCHQCHGQSWIVRPDIDCTLCNGTGQREYRRYDIEHVGPEHYRIEEADDAIL